jgi:flagellar biosynthetic protein FliR
VSQDTVINLAMQAMQLALKLGGPILIATLALGLIVSVFQAVTHIQEQTLSFIPKIIGAAVLIVVLGPWMLGQLLVYTEELGARSRPWWAGSAPCSTRVSCWLSTGEQQVIAFLPGARRISPLFIFAPLFSSKSIPRRVKGLIAVALSFGLAPIVKGKTQLDPDVMVLAGLMLKEILVGLAYAFTLGALFAAITTAGAILDTVGRVLVRGARRPRDGQPVRGASPNLYSLVGVAVLIAIGGDTWIIEGLARTYELVPLLASPELGVARSRAPGWPSSPVFVSAIEICAPILLALTITDAAIGVVSRVVPQLNVFAVSFPAKVAVGLILIGVSLPFAANWFADELQRSVGAALESLRVA